LKYSFAETVAMVMPLYAMRAIGGMIFLAGVLIMVYNVWRTIGQAKREAAELDAKLAAKLSRAGA